VIKISNFEFPTPSDIVIFYNDSDIIEGKTIRQDLMQKPKESKDF
jgi:hypothetical protein